LTVRVSRLGDAFAALGVVARNGDVRRVELAWGASVSAEWAHFVGLGVFAYAHGGTTAVGIAGLVRLLPAAVIAPFASSLGDRFRRERFLFVIALSGAAALVVSAAGAMAGDRSVVFGAAAAVGVCSTLFRPALQAILPSLARTATDLIAANGATSTIESLGTLVGPLTAGLLVAFADVAAVFAAGAAAFLVSAALLVGVSVEGHVAARASRVEYGFSRGFRAIGEVPRARLLVGLITAQTFVRGCLNVLIVVAAYQVLHHGASAVGYLTAAVGAGGLVGALGAVSLRGERLAPPFGWALVCWGLPIVLIAPLPYLVPVVILLAVVGAANSVEDVAGFTLLQRSVPDDVLARVLGVTWGLAMGAVAIGSLVAPLILRAIGLRQAFLVVGAILPVFVLVSYRRLVKIDAEVVPPPQLALIDCVAVFAPLSLVAKERIAAHLVRVDVTAGDVVIHAGEIGDRFYVVEDGQLTIEAHSGPVCVGPGDFFGEIALLRDVPRTATVRADTDARLYALERDDFLAVVTQHSAARREAHAAVTTRLASG
jgi:MFS family permease